MKILVLTFYFEPDLGAGSFRASALVKALGEKTKETATIDVLTTRPNRYHGYQTDAQTDESRKGVTIHRIELPEHKSGLLDQARAFATFARRVVSKTRGAQYDLVFATSSRLMTAALGSVVARRTKARLYLDIRDIFADTIGDLYSGKLGRMLLPFVRWIERRTVEAATHVNVVSPGFLDYFRTLRPDLDFRCFTNGIDDVFIGRDFSRNKVPNSATRILYAGNIGAGQGLHRILPAASRRLGVSYEFLVVGDGGMRRTLEHALEGNSGAPVQLVAPVPRDTLITYYRDADILFLHLNDHRAFHKVLPSKIFEFAATGKPILAGVGGYARKFIEAHVENAAVFDPCDVDGMVEALGRLQIRLSVREGFIKDFRRSSIMSRFAEDVVMAAKGGA